MMNLTSNMIDKLHEIERIDGGRNACQLDVPVDELGHRLIELYYTTNVNRIRVLITQFLTDAGGEWLFKLVTSQHQQLVASEPAFKTASMDDYLTALAANDDFERSVQHFDLAS